MGVPVASSGPASFSAPITGCGEGLGEGRALRLRFGAGDFWERCCFFFCADSTDGATYVPSAACVLCRQSSVSDQRRQRGGGVARAQEKILALYGLSVRGSGVEHGVFAREFGVLA
eukprot:1859524-Rhodomonas_salina.1